MEGKMETSKPNKPAPVLTAAQQKKSIAGGAKVPKKVVLNTMDSPLDLEWPRYGVEREEKMLTLLSEHLGPLRVESVSIPRKSTAEISRKDRAQWRKAERLKKRETSGIDKNKMSDCIVGLRDVLKAIGTGQVSLVVCDRNPNPPTLTKLLVPLCQLKEIPLVALKNFTTTVKKLLHIPRCLTLAFKNSAKERSSPLYPLYSTVMEICVESGVLTVPINKEKTAGDADPALLPLPETAIVEEKHPTERFHLKRAQSGRGVGGFCFVPGQTSNPLKKDGDVNDGWAHFISIGNMMEMDEKSLERQPAVLLRPCRIKQIQPNENKKRKKKKTI